MTCLNSLTSPGSLMAGVFSRRVENSIERYDIFQSGMIPLDPSCCETIHWQKELPPHGCNRTSQ